MTDVPPPLVVSLVQPGERVNAPPPDAERIGRLIRAIVDALTDVAIATSGFRDTHANLLTSIGPPPSEVSAEQRRVAWDAESARESAVIASHSAEWSAAGLSVRDEIDLARLEIAKQDRAAGKIPDSYANRACLLFARSFVFALDMLQELLDELAGVHSVPESVASQRDALRDAFPTVKGLRDSAHHQEDRVQGRARGKPLPRAPVMTQHVHAPQGGYLRPEGVTNGSYEATIADGTLASIAISVENLRRAGNVVQGVLDAFIWRGSPKLLPD